MTVPTDIASLAKHQFDRRPEYLRVVNVVDFNGLRLDIGRLPTFVYQQFFNQMVVVQWGRL